MLRLSLRTETGRLGIALLFSPAWMLSHLRANSWTSSPSPATKLGWETTFTENFAGSATRHEKMAVEGDRFNVYATSHQSILILQWSFRPTWIRFLRLFPPQKMRDTFTGADLRRQGHYRGANCGRGTIAPARHLRWAAVCGRRRARQPGRASRERIRGLQRNSQFPGQRRANGESPCARLERNAARGGDRDRTHGALGVSGTGESAIDKLIPALTRLRAMPLPSDPAVGPCTLNIGLIEGGARRT